MQSAVGALALPDEEEEDEGPPDGLTLDAAINQLVKQNFDLRTKWMEIPQARADVLTASLRANPLVFATASSIPYGQYSAQRPGESDYSATVIYPVDVSHKRAARTEVACEAQRVLEAQYQDAVRLAIDRLYSAYLDVITARETLRYTKANRDGLTQGLSAGPFAIEQPADQRARLRPGRHPTRQRRNQRRASRRSRCANRCTCWA